MSESISDKPAIISDFLFKNWLIALVLVAISIVFSIWIQPKVAAVDSQIIGAWGLIVSVWGIPLSLAGFAITIWQLIRTQRAAEAAKIAINKIKNEISSLNVVLEVRTARRHVAQLKEVIHYKNWDSILSIYDNIRESLANIDESSAKLDIEGMDNIKDSRASILSVYDSISRDRTNGFSNILVDNLAIDLINLDEILIAIEFRLKESVGAQ